MTRPAWAVESDDEPTIQDIDLTGVAAGKYQLPSPGTIVDVDGFAIEMEWSPSAAMDASDFYAWTLDTADGNAAVTAIYQAATGTWSFTVRNSATVVLSILANQDGSLSNTNMLAKAGDVMRIRFWYFPRRGICGARLWVNGVAAMAKTAAASGAVIPAPSAVYLGSNRGSVTGEIVGQLRRFRVLRAAAILTDAHAEIVIIGDSTSAALQAAFSQKATHTALYTSGQYTTRRGIAVLAVPGENIAEQTTRWQACRYRGDGLVVAVVIDVGINSADDSVSGATMISQYQALVDDVAANNPNAKIVICETVPCKGYLGALKWAELQTLNAAITGSGITGVDARVASPAALNDGTGNLAAAYDYGDHVHPPDAGRALRCAAVKTALQSLAVLP